MIFFKYDLTVQYLPTGDVDQEEMKTIKFSCKTFVDEKEREKCILDTSSASYYRQGKELIILRHNSFGTIVHEIGHAFGLADTYVEKHKDKQPNSLMKCSYQNNPQQLLDFTLDDLLGVSYTFCLVNNKVCKKDEFKLSHHINFEPTNYLNFYAIFNELEYIIAKYDVATLNDQELALFLKRIFYFIDQTKYQIENSLNQKTPEILNSIQQLQFFQMMEKFKKFDSVKFKLFLQCYYNLENSVNTCLDQSIDGLDVKRN